MENDILFTEATVKKTLNFAYIVFIATYLIFLVLAFLAYRGQLQLVSSTNYANRYNYFALRMEDHVSMLKGLDAGTKGFLLTKDSSFLKPHHRAESQIDSLLTVINNYREGEVIEFEEMKKVRAISYELLSLQKKLLNAPEEKRNLLLKYGRVKMDTMTSIVAHLKENKLTKLNYYRHFQNEAIQKAPTFLLTIIVVALLIFAVSAFVIIKFIRSLIKIQLDLAHKIEEANKANKELDLYAFTLTHHLQEPLRKVRLFISRFESKSKNFLTEGGHKDEKVFLDKALESAELAQKYLDEFLEFSRLLHHNKIERMAVNLNTIIEKVLKYYQAIIQEKNADISIDKMPIIWGAETHMYALWSHLIDNALKFSHPERPPKIKIENMKNENKMIHLRISDNGMGFDMAHSEKIFDIFQRLHKSHLNKGMGIGLAVCKRVVEAYKGNITVQSEPDLGTVFDVYFPATVMAG